LSNSDLQLTSTGVINK